MNYLPMAGPEASLLIGQAVKAGPQVIQGPEGPGLVHRGLVIHRAGDPSQQAREWVSQAAARRASPSAPSLALVFGLGLGWHLSRLLEAYPSIRIMVYEPDRSVMDIFESHNVLGPSQEPQIFTDFRRFEAMLAEEVVHGGNLPLVVSVPGYQEIFPEAARAFHSKIESEIARLKVIAKTREATGSAFMENLIANAPRCLELPDLMLLKGRFLPRPAFLVGAGPSLSQNGHLLREVGDRGLIIAAAAALKPLLRLKVRPDVVLVLESSDTSSYLRLGPEDREFLGRETVLALAAGCHPSHFLAQGFVPAIYHLTGGEAQLFSQGLFLPQGGNAGTATVALAYVWGLAPLILVGQDQAYQGDLLHALGTEDSLTETERPDSFRVPGVFGSVAETNSGLMASVNWLSEAAATMARQGRAPKLINSSAQGASVPGFEEIPLERVMAALGPVPDTWKITELLPQLPRPALKELKGDIKQMSVLLSQLRGLIGANFQKSIAEMMNISKISAFLGQLLAPALASGHKAAMLKSLSWADTVLLRLLASLSGEQPSWGKKKGRR